MSNYIILNKEKVQLLTVNSQRLNVDNVLIQELVANLQLCVESIHQCYDAISLFSGKTMKHETPTVSTDSLDFSWIKTFSSIYDSKLNDIQSKLDLNNLVAIFNICTIQVSCALRGYIELSNGSYNKRRPLYSHLQSLHSPITQFLTKFVTMATHMNCQHSSNFLDGLTDLSSVYLDLEVLATRRKSSDPSDHTAKLMTVFDDFFMTAYPASIEPRLDTCLKCRTLNNVVAPLVCPLLLQVLDKCRRMQNKEEHITLAAYVKFILLYARLYKLYRQAHLDSDIVLEQARFLGSPVFSHETRQAKTRLESLLPVNAKCNIQDKSILQLRSDGNTKVFAHPGGRRMNETYILSVKSVTEIYENLKALPLGDQLVKIPTQFLTRKRRQITEIDLHNLKLIVNSNISDICKEKKQLPPPSPQQQDSEAVLPTTTIFEERVTEDTHIPKEEHFIRDESNIPQESSTRSGEIEKMSTENDAETEMSIVEDVLFIENVNKSDPTSSSKIESSIGKLVSGSELILYKEFETLYNTKPDLRVFLQRLESKVKNPLVNIYEIVHDAERSYRAVLSSFVMDGTTNLENEMWSCENYFEANSTDELTLHHITTFFYVHNYMNQVKFYKRGMSSKMFIPLSYISYEPQCKCIHCVTNTNFIEEYCIDLYLTIFKNRPFDACSPSVNEFIFKISSLQNQSPIEYARYLKASKDILDKASLIVKKKEIDTGLSFLDFCVRCFWEVFIGFSLEAEYSSSKKKDKFKPLKKRK